MQHSLPENERSANGQHLFEAMFTRAEAMDILGVSRPTIMKFIKQGKLRAIKTGSHWKIHPRDLRAFMDGKSEEEKS